MNPPYIQGFFKIRNNVYLSGKIFSDIRRGGNLPEKSLSKIQTKTSILLGNTDSIIDVYSIEVFQKEIKPIKVVILKDCDYTPMIQIVLDCMKLNWSESYAMAVTIYELVVKLTEKKLKKTNVVFY